MDLENMTGHRKMWWKRMLKIHGSEDAVREFVKEGGRLGGLHTGPKGLGSPKISEQKKAEIRRKGLEARRAK